jgi:hypothetical protein
MSQGQELQIAQGFSGLNRAVAPVYLPPSQSPDSVNACPSAKTGGLLGPRLGRTRITNKTNPIIGVTPFCIPGQRIRIIGSWDGTGGVGVLAAKTGDAAGTSSPADGDLMPNTAPSSTGPGSGGATWAAVAGAWPAQAGGALLRLAGWDRIDITGLSVSQTGVGTTNGTAKTISNGGAALADYGVLLFGGAYYMPSFTATMGEGKIRLQGKIAGVWTTMMTWWMTNDSALNISQDLVTGVGQITEVRVTAEVLSGVGTIGAASLNISMYLVYGAVEDIFTVS